MLQVAALFVPSSRDASFVDEELRDVPRIRELNQGSLAGLPGVVSTLNASSAVTGSSHDKGRSHVANDRHSAFSTKALLAAPLFAALEERASTSCRSI